MRFLFKYMYMGCSLALPAATTRIAHNEITVNSNLRDTNYHVGGISNSMGQSCNHKAGAPLTESGGDVWLEFPLHWLGVGRSH